MNAVEFLFLSVDFFLSKHIGLFAHEPGRYTI